MSILVKFRNQKENADQRYLKIILKTSKKSVSSRKRKMLILTNMIKIQASNSQKFTSPSVQHFIFLYVCENYL